MQKYEDAVMLMQNNFKNVNILFPNNLDINIIEKGDKSEPYSDEVVDFLNELSSVLMKDFESRDYSDVITFAFFCRKANILNLKKKSHSDSIRFGRGLLFHIAPSNVPVNFAYSLLCGLLSGNRNIVRLPSKDFKQVELILNALKKVTSKPDFKVFEKKIILVKYNRDSDVTKYLSSICDVRIIWGGDDTISLIRNNPISARAFDITFADRYSICAINTLSYLNDVNIKGQELASKIAELFYNDTYLFDQNACTAPHLVVWVGNIGRVEEAKKIFWSNMHNLLHTKYKISPVLAIDKLTNFYKQAVFMDVNKEIGPDNLLWRVSLNALTENIENFRCPAGYFSEYYTDNLNSISKVVNKKYQTMAYYGFDYQELLLFINDKSLSGIDRVVPIGKTTDFSLIWDGYDLINMLTRQVTVL